MALGSAALVTTLGALLVGCGGGGGGSSSTCPPFARIAAGDFGKTGDRLWWTLEVEQMPAELTFDQAEVHANLLEYRWAVDIDANKDGQTDLSAAVTHYRRSNVPETTTADILSATQQDLWSVTGALSSTSGNVDVTLTGNVFRFEVDVAEDAGLAQVTARAQSTWTTYHQFGPGLTDRCEDSLR